jgi:Putative quorum-sensing-regulated virulence factor
MTQKYEQYLKSPEWAEVSRRVIERDGCCVRCKNPESRPLQAHHVKYDHVYDDLNHLDCLVCWCKSCHQAHHDAEEAEPITMPFGQYRGRRLDELPQNYVQWLSTIEIKQARLREAVLRRAAWTSFESKSVA